jgi:hypothetical protein
MPSKLVKRAHKYWDLTLSNRAAAMFAKEEESQQHEDSDVSDTEMQAELEGLLEDMSLD